MRENSDNTSVAVMMSSYNGELYIEEQLKSILDQTGVDVYLYIRDDGSRQENKIDAVYPGFSFQIEPVMDRENYLEWNHRFWGMIRLVFIRLEFDRSGVYSLSSNAHNTSPASPRRSVRSLPFPPR